MTLQQPEQGVKFVAGPFSDFDEIYATVEQTVKTREIASVAERVIPPKKREPGPVCCGSMLHPWSQHSR